MNKQYGRVSTSRSIWLCFSYVCLLYFEIPKTREIGLVFWETYRKIGELCILAKTIKIINALRFPLGRLTHTYFPSRNPGARPREVAGRANSGRLLHAARWRAAAAERPQRAGGGGPAACPPLPIPRGALGWESILAIQWTEKRPGLRGAASPVASEARSEGGTRPAGQRQAGGRGRRWLPRAQVAENAPPPGPPPPLERRSPDARPKRRPGPAAAGPKRPHAWAPAAREAGKGLRGGACAAQRVFLMKRGVM